jgi:hypothetical protein
MSLIDQLLLGPCLTEKHEGVFVTEPLRFVAPAKRVGRHPVKFHTERKRA